MIKNFSLRLLYWNAAALLEERRHQNRRLFQVARSEWGTVRAMGFVIAACFDLAAKIPGALVQRRRILKHRTLGDRAIQSLLMNGEGDA